jgi:hypothetical protein
MRLRTGARTTGCLDFEIESRSLYGNFKIDLAERLTLLARIPTTRECRAMERATWSDFERVGFGLIGRMWGPPRQVGLELTCRFGNERL